MIVGILRLELILHAPGSLKEKRGIVQKLLGRCRSRFPVSCAETGHHDLWQRCECAFAVVGNHAETIRSIFSSVEEEIEKSGAAEIGASDLELLHY